MSSYRLELTRQREEAGFDPLLLAQVMGSMMIGAGDGNMSSPNQFAYL